MPLVLVGACSSDRGPDASPSAPTPGPGSGVVSERPVTLRPASQLVLTAADLKGLTPGPKGSATRTVRSAAALLACLGAAVDRVDSAGSDDARSGDTRVSSAAFVLADTAAAAGVARAATSPRATACMEGFGIAQLSSASLSVQPRSAAVGAAFRGVAKPTAALDVRVLRGGRGIVVLQAITPGAATPPTAHTALLERLVRAVNGRLTS